MKNGQEAEIWTILQTEQGKGVLLRPLGLNVVVPIFVGRLEAQSIIIGLDGVKVERPLTHDLFLDMAAKMGLVLEQVEVWDLKHDVFYARLVFAAPRGAGKNRITLDARPSDALALAVRVPCPILVSAAVIDTAGIPTDAVLNAPDLMGPGAPPPESPRPEARSLRQRLEDALAAEDYEQAAEIRDKLKGAPEKP
ncbi:MAG: bifunctional nuclease family protein [Treponema sp.]|jgi:bifunctional DNase/RNase|nr:bifunctional nuclease family protein [Treponema sp.]